MRLERFLQIAMATLAAFGTLLLSMGQRVPGLALIAIVAPAVSLYITDIRGWFRVPRSMGNLLAFVAAAVILSRAYLSDSEEILLSIAYLLVCLQLVLLFEKKEVRVYWQLAVASLLQVVVASVLNEGMLFGILLLLYLFVGLLTLSLFFIYRETLHFSDVRDDQHPLVAPARPSEPLPGRGSAPAWPLAGQKPVFLASVSGNLTQSVLGWSLIRRMISLSLGSMAFTVFLFFAVPRVSRTGPFEASAIPQRAVGFTSQVRLGELGEAVQNPEVVMQVKFLDGQTNQPYRIASEPMFRGSLLVKYRRGRWFQPSSGSKQLRELPQARTTVGRVRQQIILEPLSEPVVCCIYPVERIGDNVQIRYSESARQVERITENRRLEIELATTGFWNHIQTTITPHYGELTEAERLELLDVPADLEGLRQLTDEIIERSGLAPEDRVAKAATLEHYLRDSGNFRYSLRGVARNPALDPVEDFLLENRSGHCEYFASALALMLRTQGIPARMVVGFKGGDLNSFDHVYSVRQLNAHTWVEAYIESDQVPQRSIGHPLYGHFGGGWLRLDPTPASGLPEHAGGRLQNLQQFAQYVQRLWSTYVVGLTFERQREAIYAPLVRTGKGVYEFLKPETWRSLAQRINWKAIRDGSWFSWRGGLVGMAVSLALVGLYRGARLLGRRCLASWRRRRADQASRDRWPVEFYRRFEELAARHGFWRRSSQTALEFATHVGQELVLSTGRPAAAELPARMAAAFYRVRFGGRALDSHEKESVEQALDEIRAALERADDVPLGSSPRVGS